MCAGSSNYHNMSMRAAGGPAMYDAYVANFGSNQTPHLDGTEATSNGVEASARSVL